MPCYLYYQISRVLRTRSFFKNFSSPRPVLTSRSVKLLGAGGFSPPASVLTDALRTRLRTRALPCTSPSLGPAPKHLLV